jgi:glycosyltransferase involved in cell wall biosynthesis
MGGEVLVCLLPVRNGEDDLQGYLESVSRFADALVALDDGSDDRTHEILQAHPLTATLLRNPPRPTAAGWDDARNRNRLLEAAAALDPDWVVSLDVDERIDGDDAAALRRFVEGDALPDCAYGFRHYRTWHGRYVPRPRWIYRLFSFEPGQSLPGDRLHFDPIPTSIPRSRWVRTSIRVRHLAADTEARIARRLAKYREADPHGDYSADHHGLDAPPSGPVLDWQPRDPDEPVLLGPGQPAPDAERELVCLLPVRNGEQDLPGYLGSVERFADAVVALDDGSTDRTREILEASPLVHTILTNPSRPAYAGWDDAANRGRLLGAAEELRPRWVMFLDVDERIPADDAAALRGFVERDARAGWAYLFRVHRMVGSDRFDRAELWVPRLFAYEPGARLHGSALHLVAVPESIPPARWVRTTVRIQHLAGSTPERRSARYAKYREADPEGAFQSSYDHLLAPPRHVSRWRPRAPQLPVVPGAAHAEEAVRDLSGPAISAVIVAHDDESTIEEAVRSVVEQEVPEPFEVIVAAGGGDGTAAVVRARFPEVAVIEVPDPALPGAARNAGVAVAKGDFVSFPGSHVRLPQGSLAARLRAHERGYPMVTGTVRNGTPTPAGWASYFLDHSGSLPGRPSGLLASPPAHCSYGRDFLVDVGGFPEDLRAGEDTVVNHRLFRLGYRAYRAADVELVHHTPCTTIPRLLRHHFTRGRAMTRVLAAEHVAGGRLLDAAAARSLYRRYVPRRLRHTGVNVRRWGGDLQGTYRRVFPLVVAGTVAAWAGAWVELLVRSLGSRSPATSPTPGRR